MTFKALFNQFTKFFKSNPYYHKTSVIKKNLNFIYYLTFLIIFFIVYTAVSNKINNSNKLVAQNINKTVNSDEFYLLKNFLISNLRSPYKEYKYIIENNDSIEKILNKFNIKNSEVSFITKKLKERKLTNIYAGRELTIIVKNELKSKKNILVNIFYPISNTLSIEIRKNQEKFEIKENILQ
jgi:hypothetical protein